MKKTGKLFIILAAVCLLYSCQSNNTGNHDIVRKVKVLKVEKDAALQKRVFTGVLKESREVNLAFRVAGPIQLVHIKAGDFVKKGQLIATIDPRDYQIQLNVASAQYKQVSAETERVKELFKRISVTEADFEKQWQVKKWLPHNCSTPKTN